MENNNVQQINIRLVTEPLNSAVFNEGSALYFIGVSVQRFPIATSLSDQTETDGTAAFSAPSPAASLD